MLITASISFSQNQRVKGTDNRTYTFKEITVKPELEGKITFDAYFKKHFKSPINISTPLNFSFVIERNGLALNTNFPNGTDPAVMKEAKRVLKSAGKWKVGTKDGNAVRVNYVYIIQ